MIIVPLLRDDCRAADAHKAAIENVGVFRGRLQIHVSHQVLSANFIGAERPEDEAAQRRARQEERPMIKI
jgi:hypothetical protein